MDALGQYRGFEKPALKWAGGKRWLIPTLRKIYDPLGGPRVVDPFIGAASVPLGLTAKRALISDINMDLVNFYFWVMRDGLDIPTDLVRLENTAAMYAWNRDRFNALHEIRKVDNQWSKEAAALFYYLNRTGFNGLCRYNSDGFYNVPFGKYKKINYETNFMRLRKVMSNWELSCGDFSHLKLEPGDFLYLDPPYDAGFTKFAKEDFSWEDQERLAVWAGRHTGPVVASNKATTRTMSLYQQNGFQIFTIPAPRRISCNGDRKPAQEMLAIKNCVLPT